VAHHRQILGKHQISYDGKVTFTVLLFHPIFFKLDFSKKIKNNNQGTIYYGLK